MHLYTQLLVSFLPLLIAVTTMLLLQKFRADAQRAQQMQQHVQPAALQPVPQVDEPVAAAGPAVDAAAAPDVPAAAASPPANTAPTSSPNIPAGEEMPLRFLHGERAPISHICNRRAPIRTLKAELAPLIGVGGTGGDSGALTTPRIMLIVLGQPLRDDATLSEYASLSANDIVHVHVIPAQQAEPSTHAQQQQQQHEQHHLHHHHHHPHQHMQAQPQPRGWTGYPGAAPADMMRLRPGVVGVGVGVGGPQILIPPPPRMGGGLQFGAQVAFGNNGAMHIAAAGGGNQVRMVVHPPDLLARTLSAMLTAVCGSAWGCILVMGVDILSDNSFFMLVALTGLVCVAIGRGARQ